MSLNKLIQFRRQWMARKKRDADTQTPSRELSLELVPALEEPSLFQTRKEEVQVLLTDMFLRLHQRGRPKKDEKEEAYAA